MGMWGLVYCDLKSQFMVITNKVINNYPVLSIGGNDIVRVESFKYLGVLIDNNLKFQCQVDHVKSKLNRLCGVSFKLKNYFNVRTAKNMYYACIYSVVSYCIAVWELGRYIGMHAEGWIPEKTPR